MITALGVLVAFGFLLALMGFITVATWWDWWRSVGTWYWRSIVTWWRT